MTCNNCGTVNESGSKFCISCGNALNGEIKENNFINEQINNVVSEDNTSLNLVEKPIITQNANVNNVEIPVNNVVNNQSNVQNSTINSNVPNGNLNIISFMVNTVLKPISTLKNEENKIKMSDSLIIGLIVSVCFSILNLLKIMFTTINSGKLFSNPADWYWSVLKDISYFKLLGKYFLIFACGIFAIGLIMYLASLVVKKEIELPKAVAVSGVSLLPLGIVMFVIAPIFGSLWEVLASVLNIAGLIYSLLIIYCYLNEKVKLENDKLIYFNLICLSIIICICYFVYIKFFLVDLYSSSFGSLLDLFN